MELAHLLAEHFLTPANKLNNLKGHMWPAGRVFETPGLD